MILAPPQSPASVGGWRCPPTDLVLPVAGVHVWRVEMCDVEGLAQQVVRTLSPGELRRASRYVSAGHGRRFIARRGLLRLVLARYVGCDPVALALRPGARGKPELVGSSTGLQLRFNCTQSQGTALYAVACGRRVGVDVEVLRPLPEVEQLARTCLSDREQVALRAVVPGARDAAFLHWWTAKEAYAKAIGEGLHCAFERVEVSFARDSIPVLQAVDGDPDAALSWSLRTFSPSGGCIGALAVEDVDVQLGCFDALGLLRGGDGSSAGW